jgi:hypothetical protein
MKIHVGSMCGIRTVTLVGAQLFLFLQRRPSESHELIVRSTLCQLITVHACFTGIKKHSIFAIN